VFEDEKSEIINEAINDDENKKIPMNKPKSKILTKKIIKVKDIYEGEKEKEIFVDDKGNEVDEK
jgi:hypothetical protein